MFCSTTKYFLKKQCSIKKLQHSEKQIAKNLSNIKIRKTDEKYSKALQEMHRLEEKWKYQYALHKTALKCRAVTSYSRKAAESMTGSNQV